MSKTIITHLHLPRADLPLFFTQLVPFFSAISSHDRMWLHVRVDQTQFLQLCQSFQPQDFRTRVVSALVLGDDFWRCLKGPCKWSEKEVRPIRAASAINRPSEDGR